MSKVCALVGACLWICKCIGKCASVGEMHVSMNEDTNISANLSCDYVKHSATMWAFPQVCKKVFASMYVIVQRSLSGV